MRKFLPYCFFSCMLLAGCQKVLHWDLPSEGTLLHDANGNCFPVAVTGNFIINKPVGESDFLTIHVSVTSAGTYTIMSDSINGYRFKTSGIFNTNGVQDIKLPCSGKPISTGTDHFNIHYNNSICAADVIVLSDTVPSATYILQGSPNNCMNDTIKGSYLQTVPLDTSDKVIISVNVITTGKYSVSTKTVNGYSFSGEGIFTTTGIQSITLKGSGKPENAGNDVFTMVANNNSCGFSIIVSSIVQVTNPLYFPLTASSFWIYKDPVFNDTIRRYVNGDSLINDTDFVKVSEIKSYNPQTYFFNLDSGRYYEFAKVEKYNTSFGYSPPVYGLLPFLKEGLGTGASWESDVFKGNASYGQVLYFKYGYYCVSSIATKVVNGFGFKDVYVIAVYPQLRSDAGTWGSTNEVYYNYYAKGVGLICVEESINGHDFQSILQIVNWKVN